jgi:hypothetical protein
MMFLIKLSVVLLTIVVAPTAASAASVVKVTWNISEVSGGSSVSLRDVATINSKGKKSWKKSGDCTLTKTKLRMGVRQSCTLTLTVAKSGKFPSKTFKKKITNPDAYSGPKLRVGDVGPGGGKVFYVGSFTSTGSICNKSCNYLESAPFQLSQPWCNILTTVNTSGTAVAEQIGSGMSNTRAIAAHCSSGAAKSILGQVIGLSSDWFLPSVMELGALQRNARTLGLNVGNEMYWTSTEGWGQGSRSATSLNLYGGSMQPDEKNMSWVIAPVRAF